MCALVLLGACILETTANCQGTVRRIADLNAGSSGCFASNLTVYANALYFSAYTSATGRELWKYDGAAITLVSNINATATDIGGGVLVGNNSDPSFLKEFNGALYFSAFDPMRGGELWRWDGTSAVRVSDINPDANDLIKSNPASAWPSELTVIGNTLYFSANGSPQKLNYELWKFDGTTAALADNLHPDSGSDFSSYPHAFTAFNGGLYFMADDGAHGYELWRRGLTVSTLWDLNPGGSASSSYPKYFTALGDQLYFQAFHDAYGYELWRTDGTNVSLVVDLNPGTASSSPDHLTVFKNRLYFSATDGIHGYELWQYDGSAATLVSDINPTGDSSPKNLTLFRDQLCFVANDGVHGWELWTYDGVSATLVTDLNPAGDSFPESLTVFGNDLYFVATTPSTGYEIWKYDGTNVVQVTDINPGPGSSYPENLAVYNNELCFSATDDGLSNWELWALTMPLVAAKPVSLLNPAASTGSLLFSFQTEPQRIYDIEWADTPSGAWAVLSSWTGTGGRLTITNPAPSVGQRFYRVGAR